MGYKFARRLMLEQLWNYEKGYVKPIHFPAGKSSNTFYFSASNQSNFHFGILGVLKHSLDDASEVIRSVDRHFQEAVSGEGDLIQVVEALIHRFDLDHTEVELSFHIWTRHVSLDHIPVISFKMPTLTTISRNLEVIVKTLDAHFPDSQPHPHPHQSQTKPSYKITNVPLAQTQYLMFTTDSSYLPNQPVSPFHSKFQSKRHSPFDSTQATNLKTIFELSNHLSETISKSRAEGDGELSMVLLDLHDFTVLSESTHYGIENWDSKIETILSTIPKTYDHFAVKLIVSELMMNAYKHGNNDDSTKPIKVIVGIHDEELVIEVLDMNIRREDIPIKTVIKKENLLDENGRGLYLVNAFSDALTIDNNSVTVRIHCKK